MPATGAGPYLDGVATNVCRLERGPLGRKGMETNMAESVEILIAYSSEGGRVCPLPIFWNELWEMLPHRRRVGVGWEPPPPLVLAAWAETTPDAKRARLHEHFQWAFQHGALDDVAKLIRSLTEDQWLHTNEWPA